MTSRVLVAFRWGAVFAVAYGLAQAILLRWTCDDAFISFRYAQNLVDGHGLVYNSGEWVEGYTNFLWTMLLALGLLVGCEPIDFAHVLALLCHAGTLLLLVRTARRQDGSYGFPIAAVGFALHRHAAEFATSGLETALFTFLGTAALVRVTTARRPSDYGAAGLLITLTCLTRPDGVVLCAPLVILTAMTARQQQTWLPLLLLVAPLVFLGLPYYAWRYTYYGYPFPNTFYAKSASSPYLGSGLWYVWAYFCYYFALVPAPFTALGLAWTRRALPLEEAGWRGLRAPLALAGTIALFLVYVCWVGGDFMFARFCIPVTPALFLCLQIGLDEYQYQLRRVFGTLLLACTFCSTLYLSWIGSWGITEERHMYNPTRLALSEKIAEALRGSLRGVEAKVALLSAQAMLAYQAGFPIAIETNGLTDEHIAHRRVASRGRVGHEKSLPLWDDYLNERGVNFTFAMASYVEFPDDRIGSLRNIEFLVADIEIPDGHVPGVEGGRQDLWVKGTMITYEGSLMRQLAGRKTIRFTPFEEHLDDYIANKLQANTKELREDYAAFKRFYFDHTNDPERQRAFERALGLAK